MEILHVMIDGSFEAIAREYYQSFMTISANQVNKINNQKNNLGSS